MMGFPSSVFCLQYLRALRSIFLFLVFLSLVCFGQTDTVATTSEYLSLTSISLLLALFLAVAFLMYSYVMQDAQAKSFAEAEIRQIFVSVIFIVFFMGVFAIVNGFVISQLVPSGLSSSTCTTNPFFEESTYSSTGKPVATVVPCLNYVSAQYLDTISGVGSPLLDLARKQLSENIEGSAKASESFGLACHTKDCLWLGFTVQPSKGRSMSRALLVFESLSQSLGSLRAQSFLVSTILPSITPILFFFGVMFRCLFFTRKFGGLLIACSFATAFIIPGMYAFESNIAQQYSISGTTVSLSSQNPYAVIENYYCTPTTNPYDEKVCNKDYADYYVYDPHDPVYETAKASGITILECDSPSMCGDRYALVSSTSSVVPQVTKPNSAWLDPRSDWCPLRFRIKVYDRYCVKINIPILWGLIKIPITICKNVEGPKASHLDYSVADASGNRYHYFDSSVYPNPSDPSFDIYSSGLCNTCQGGDTPTKCVLNAGGNFIDATYSYASIDISGLQGKGSYEGVDTTVDKERAKSNTAVAGMLGFQAVILPIFNLLLAVAFVRGFSPILGGDVEIPGLSKVL